MFDKLKMLINKKQGELSNKKKIENLVVFIIILIITVLIIKMICAPDDKTKTEISVKEENLVETNNSNIEYNELEIKLENILSQIQGVGNVKVLITYSQTSELIPLYNEDEKETSTEEKDDAGGTRTISEVENKKEVVYKEIDGEKNVITQSVINPKIEGAIITAEGGDNIEIRSSIIQAVEAVTGIATHKIQVYKLAVRNEVSYR